MQNFQKDISYLLSYDRNISFIEACYDVLLSRPIALCEIRNSLELLSGGFSKKAFIYWITLSNEFNGRFSIYNIADYKTSYNNFFKISKHYTKRRLFTSKNEIQKKVFDSLKIIQEKMTEFSFSYDAIPECIHDDNYTFADEYDFLSLCQINQIAPLIKEMIPSGSCTIVGNLAGDFISNNDALKINIANSIDKLYSQKITDYMFITNLVIIYQLMNSKNFPSLAKTVRDKFIFIMPSPPVPQHQIGVIWDANWDNLEIEPDNSYCRWFHGDSNVCSISIYNNSMQYKKVILDFTLCCLEENAEVFLHFNKTLEKYTFNHPRIHALVTLYLKPANNQIVFTYIGKGIIPKSQQTRLVKFSLNDLSITELGEISYKYNSNQIYNWDEKKLGSGYLPFTLPENYLRSSLHKIGFFEINVYHVTKTVNIFSKGISRYNYSNEVMNRNCYYFSSHSQQSQALTFPGIDIYVARRKGLL